MSNRTLVFTAERLLQILKSFPAANDYIVGFSGGADSTALLHALNTVRDQLDTSISAVHVNHGLHDDADLWQQQCEVFCRQNKIKLLCLRISLENRTGYGLEAEARHLRYEAISALLTTGTSLLTAHHADDQAETLLLNLMRGSGVDGLSAMPESRPLGSGLLQRPMLEFQNSAILDYLHKNKIEWTEDPSNQCLNHDRNFVRHEVIPLLEKRWPEISKRLFLTRKAMTGARRLLEKLSNDYIGQNLDHPYVLKITTQLMDDPELFKLVMRRWMKQSGRATIPVYRLEAFYLQVKQASHNPNIVVTWAGSSLRLYKQKLWLCSDTGILPCPAIEWTIGQNEIDLGNDIGRLVLEDQNMTGNRSENQSGSKMTDAPGKGFSILGRVDVEESVIDLGNHHKSLKNLFQAAGIPPWLRDYIPFCKLDGELVAMGDWCFGANIESWLTENNIRMNWYPNHPLLRYIHAQQHRQTVDPACAVR
jgi:tRNA(Ile)-lysidine synthase